ncbi:MAG: helix-turn-helix domain-containing protein [Rikenellaceae bacterium]
MKPRKITAPTPNLYRVSVALLKQEMVDVSYLSDDLVITFLTAETNHSVTHPVSFAGLSAGLLMTGEATILIDYKEYNIKAGDSFVFSANSVIETLSCSADATAFLTSFSKAFIEDIQIDLSTSLPLYMRFGRNPIMHLKQKDIEEIRQFFQLIRTVINSDKERYRSQIIKTVFSAIFYLLSEINQRGGDDSEGKRGRCEVIFDEFVSLLQQYSKSERNVKFYAGKLNISAKYLSAVVKDASGKTAAKWIDESVILEAKNLLMYSGLSIQEIAHALNFSTQSFFGKYFKQHTGTSPSRYKYRG